MDLRPPVTTWAKLGRNRVQLYMSWLGDQSVTLEILLWHHPPPLASWLFIYTKGEESWLHAAVSCKCNIKRGGQTAVLPSGAQSPITRWLIFYDVKTAPPVPGAGEWSAFLRKTPEAGQGPGTATKSKCPVLGLFSKCISFLSSGPIEATSLYNFVSSSSFPASVRKLVIYS